MADNQFVAMEEINYPDGRIYIGECKNEMPNGIGTMKFADGRVYVGGFKDGKRNGVGYSTDRNGNPLYSGEIKDDERHGMGRQVYSSGDVYVGQFESDKRHGFGTFIFANGKQYIGEFKNGEAKGMGIFKNDNEVHVGEHVNGNMNGFGIIKYSNGQKVAGEFTEDNLGGIGIVTLQDDRKQAGEYIDGKINGIGIIKLPNGKKIACEALYGKNNGVGVTKFSDGSMYAGEYLNGEFEGIGVYASNRRQYMYAGELKKGASNGIGVTSYKSGEKHVGFYEEDQENGLGLALLPNGFRCFGNFEQGEFVENKDAIVSIQNRYNIRNNVYYLFIDVETTGLPLSWKVSFKETSNWPRLVQIACILCDSEGEVISTMSNIVKPDSFTIPYESTKIHGITTAIATERGEDIRSILQKLDVLLLQADYVVAHNIEFDENVIAAEFVRKGMANSLEQKKKICTMKYTTSYCSIDDNYYLYKWPKLSELYFKIFEEEFEETHNAKVDVEATAECFWELKRRGIL